MADSTSPVVQAGSWQEVRLDDWAALKALAARARQELRIQNANHDLEHIAASHDWPLRRLVVLTSERDSRLTGLATFQVASMPLVHSVGPVDLIRPMVPRYYLFEGPLLSNPGSVADASGCFARLAADMPANGVIFAFSVPALSALYRDLVDPHGQVRRWFHVLPWGAENPSCSIAWNGSVDDYLRTLSASRRQDLKRRRRKLLADASLRTEVRCFRSPVEAGQFLEDGVRISETTWQRKEFAAGLQFGGPSERAIRAAADRGTFFGCILYLDDQPAAFQCCYIHGQTCHVDQIGYDPRWIHRHHVGSILFLEMLYAFERDRVPVTSIDYQATANLFKLQTTNVQFAVRNFYLFKRTVAGSTLFSTLRTADAVSRLGARVADRLGLRRRIPDQ